jgi:hypothetical protein
LSENYIFGIPRPIVFGIMLVVLLIPSAIFIYLSYDQLGKIIFDLGTTPNLTTAKFLNQEKADDLPKFQARVLVSLEDDVMALRQQRSVSYIKTRTWLRFMSLIFGAIMIVIGSAFVLGKITGPSTKAELTIKDIGLSFLSSSPGLFLALLGTILVIVPNVTKQPISVDDTSTYMNSFAQSPTTTLATAPPSAAELKQEDEKAATTLQELLDSSH